MSLIFLAALTLLTSCKSKQQVMEKPDNLINRITLVNILADSYLIESTLQMTTPDSINKDELARRYYKDLFDRYHITNEQFESSIAYYVSEEKSATRLLNDASALLVSKRSDYDMAMQEKLATALQDTLPANDTLSANPNF